jgi:hypothetical protein
LIRSLRFSRSIVQRDIPRLRDHPVAYSASRNLDPNLIV